MTVAIVDTTVIIHILRRHSAARAWFASQQVNLSITAITWMEVIYGAAGKSGQATALALLEQFEMIYLTQVDLEWAMQRLLTHRLSHGVAVMDCLIASVCHRLQVPLYTHNVRDMNIILGSTLTVKPYE
jgi:predicted nucleic acid-binding protein